MKTSPAPPPLLLWGRPGRAIGFAESPEERENYLKEVARWEKLWMNLLFKIKIRGRFIRR